MGYNTVAVIYNDHMGEIQKQMPRLADAIRGWLVRDNDALATCFESGLVVSQDHADDLQVVVVGRNTGARLTCEEASSEHLEALAEILQAHGYGVKGPSEKRALPASNTSQMEG